MAAHTSTNPATSNSNGDARGPSSTSTVGNMPVPIASANVNRKKQKRRQKQAARLAAGSPEAHTADQASDRLDDHHSHEESAEHAEHEHPANLNGDGHDSHEGHGESGTQYDPNGPSPANDLADHLDHPDHKPKKKRNKKSRSGSHAHQDGSSTPLSTPSATYSHSHQHLHSHPHSLPYSHRFPARSSKESSIWNQSSLEERENIRTFWFELGEEERRQLVKVEKDAVLKKMKEQQKHSCSCTVCGRKRTAIEEELEVLYDAYYEELEQYANNNQGSFDEGAPIIPPPRLYQPPLRSPGQHTRTHGQYHPSRGRVQELPDDEEEDFEDDYDDEDEEDEEEDDELYSDEEYEDDEARAARADFFAFGNSLTVKDGILTVADDLLKNDGKHFIDMMEQLAERRMQREEDTQYNIAAAHQSFHAGHNHGPLDDEEYDDEEDEDYDSQEEEEFDEDEMDAMTEEQRMQEGRRMFQIFAARMFEQRVMTAYREKVAEQRQKQLIEELLEEENRNEQRNAKKAREAQKKKDKKRLQKQAKEEEKARREAERAAEEAAAKAAHEKKLEEQRIKREEQRKKREAERKAQEDERARKEAEKQRRAREERERQAEAERKQREQKEEKKRRDEAKRKEKEEREKKAKEEQERKSREQQANRDREVASRAEHAAKPYMQTKPLSHVGSIPLPSAFQAQAIPNSFQSPRYSAATPIAPSSSTPGRPRQPSQQGSHSSSPHSQTTSSEFPFQPSISPRSLAQSQSGVPGLGRPVQQQQQQHQPHLHHPQPSAPLSPLGRSNPPGFTGLGGLPGNPPGLPGMGGRPLHATEMPLYSPSTAAMSPLRGFGASGSIPPPPGINGIRSIPSGRGLPLTENSHGMPFVGHHGLTGPFAMQQPGLPKTHSRQLSASFERSPLETGTQPFPISRPSALKRPPSVAHDHHGHGHPQPRRDIDDLSTQLGSSALLDDTDLPFSSNLSQSLPGAPAPGPFASPARASFQGSLFADPLGAKHVPFAGGSSWAAPAPFGGPAFPAASTWGATTGTGWSHNAFASSGHHRPHTSRPVTVRLLAIQACKYLNTLSPRMGSDGYHDVNLVLDQAEQLRSPSEPAISLDEMLEICDTEGNSHNGGGSFFIKKGEKGQLVKFEPDTNSAVGGHRGSIVPGDIGSPVPAHSHPAVFGGFGTHAPPVLRQYSSPAAGLFGGSS
ncbi:Stress response protein nst1 [Penicillium oxalicum]|uniref:Stress response protein nst1 n=1 Tax=Penicillium oxalicum TaxID=69781 RepID=UPI0020B817AB|nr:Stress response protein nst1 [Penicillium oxalicum]KAI2793126.1 Stress response protein nst1 [Penicillium oxalicum]